jgi:hypothetical protein
LKSLTLLIIFYLQFTIITGLLTDFGFIAEVVEPVAISTIVKVCYLVAKLALTSVPGASFVIRIFEQLVELVAIVAAGIQQIAMELEAATATVAVIEVNEDLRHCFEHIDCHHNRLGTVDIE